MLLTEIWSGVAALDACCAVVRACVPEIAEAAVYQGDLDVLRLRPGCRVYQVGEPDERAWTDERVVTKQAQRWLVTVGPVVVGDPYVVSVRDVPSSYVALLGDGKPEIQAAQVLQLAALGQPITVAAVGVDALRITSDVAGQHLNVKGSANMSVALEADNLRSQGLMPSFWVARFEFEEQPNVDGSASRAPGWATRLRGYLQAGLADELLQAAHLDFNTVVFRDNYTRPDRGKTTVIEIMDVQFSALQGLGHDLSRIDSFGTAPTVEVSQS